MKPIPLADARPRISALLLMHWRANAGLFLTLAFLGAARMPCAAQQVLILAAPGEPLPGAGLPNSPFPVDAVFKTFGNPAIDELGDLAYQASWTSRYASGTVIAFSHQVFSGAGGTPPQIVAASNEYAPTAGGNIQVGNPAYLSFFDPEIDSDGTIAYIARLTGTQALPNKQGIFLYSEGAPNPYLVASTGDTVSNQAAIQSIQSILYRDSLVYASVTFAGGVGGITSSNNAAVIVYPPGIGAPEVVVQKGEPDLGGQGAVKVYDFLAPVSGTPGQNRFLSDIANSPPTFCFSQVLAVGTQSVPEVVAGQFAGVQETLVVPSSFPTYVANHMGQFTSFGNPAIPRNAPVIFFEAAYQDQTTKVGGSGIFYYGQGGAGTVVLAGASAPGAGTGVTLASLGDPILNDSSQVAFMATLKGPGIGSANNKAIYFWDGSTSGSGLSLIAQAGGLAPNTSGGVFKAFTSFVVIGEPNVVGRVFFVGQLAVPPAGKPNPGGITPANAVGLWQYIANGDSTLLLRTGEVITVPRAATPGQPGPVGPGVPKTISKFTIFSADPGSYGILRNANQSGALALNVTFTDNTQAIIGLQPQ